MHQACEKHGALWCKANMLTHPICICIESLADNCKSSRNGPIQSSRMQHNTLRLPVPRPTHSRQLSRFLLLLVVVTPVVCNCKRLRAPPRRRAGPAGPTWGVRIADEGNPRAQVLCHMATTHVMSSRGRREGFCKGGGGPRRFWHCFVLFGSGRLEGRGV